MYALRPNEITELPSYMDSWDAYIKVHASIAIREGRQMDCSDLERKFAIQKARVQKAVAQRTERVTQAPITKNQYGWSRGMNGDGGGNGW